MATSANYKSNNNKSAMPLANKVLGQSPIPAGEDKKDASSRVSGGVNSGSQTVQLSQSNSRDKIQSKNDDKEVTTTDLSHYFFPLFYAGEKGAMGIWQKMVGQGHIKRRLEDPSTRKFHVLELVNPQSNTGTWLSCPAPEWKALHLTLPHLVIVLKNFKRNFSFEVLILDNSGSRRRLSFATWFNGGNTGRTLPFLAQVPLRLEIGWNEIHVDLRELTESLYKSRYVETLKVQIYANCRLRQVFFCGDEIMTHKHAVPSMRFFANVKLISPDYGPLNHPDYYEPGPDRKREHHLTPEPIDVSIPTRLEKDLRAIHRDRYEELLIGKVNHAFRIPGTTASTNLPAAVAGAQESGNTTNTTSSSSSNNNAFEATMKEVKYIGRDALPLPPPAGVKEEAAVVVERNLMKSDPQPGPSKGIPIPTDINNKSFNLLELVRKNEATRLRKEVHELVDMSKLKVKAKPSPPSFYIQTTASQSNSPPTEPTKQQQQYRR